MPPSLAFVISQAGKQLDIGCQRESYILGRGEIGMGDTHSLVGEKGAYIFYVPTILQSEPMK